MRENGAQRIAQRAVPETLDQVSSTGDRVAGKGRGEKGGNGDVRGKLIDRSPSLPWAQRQPPGTGADGWSTYDGFYQSRLTTGDDRPHEVIDERILVRIGVQSYLPRDVSTSTGPPPLSLYTPRT